MPTSQEERESLRLLQAKLAQAKWSRMEALAQLPMKGALSVADLIATQRRIELLTPPYVAAVARLEAIGEGGASQVARCFSWQSQVCGSLKGGDVTCRPALAI
jgi:hypothetical protein